ncbi:uracil-DNA glycosylase family protein [Meridianimarinicoccus aquatilis]|uniref:Uracil-DNA glycosylase family protein n=2 Tax=Meridianimarinicoccus aquatilis TaxID=2552766 RepID=A0A4R6B498_9RHOB|nr:uracil-DNA glycosylase family protein [Fluviibacterium aquatile]
MYRNMNTPLAYRIRACSLCADRFAATATRHSPNPVVWFQPGARILIISQAPGLRVHESNTPFWDRSGARLRDWMGIEEPAFYDRSKVAILPSAFCFPGYDAGGSDLPPPPICAQTWHQAALDEIGPVPLRFLVGGYAHRRYLGGRKGVTDTVRDWRAHAPDTFVLPHPSWRNTAWLKRNPWFDSDVLPSLRERVAQVLSGC